MDKSGVYLQLYARATAPCRDYYGLTITKNEVIINIWNITHGPHVFPKRQKCPLEDIIINKPMMNDVERLFGAHVLRYITLLSCGDPKFESLPTKVFLKVLRYLAIKDIFRLGQTSKIFFELCNRDDVWRLIFVKWFGRKISREELRDGEMKGWKNLLKYKLVLQEQRRRSSITSSSSSSSARSSNTVRLPPKPLIKKTRCTNSSTTNNVVSSERAATLNELGKVAASLAAGRSNKHRDLSNRASVSVMSPRVGSLQLNNTKVSNESKQMTPNNKLNLVVNEKKCVSNLSLIDNLARDKEKLAKIKSFDMNKKLIKNTNVVKTSM